MHQLPLSFAEIIEIVAYFSSLIILLGLVFQFAVIYRRQKKLSIKMLIIIILTQVLAFIVTTVIWLKWPLGLRILYGPILFPAAIAQIVINPIVTNIFYSKSSTDRSVGHEK